MWLDQVWNPGHLALESDALPTALRGPASHIKTNDKSNKDTSHHSMVGWFWV